MAPAELALLESEPPEGALVDSELDGALVDSEEVDDDEAPASGELVAVLLPL